jgi:branched-chain amino acid transport system substrate-binding protein
VRRGLRSVATLALMGSVALTGCGGGGGGGGGQDAPAEGEPIRIGFFSPQTGFGAPDGQSALSGARLAVKEVNDGGGIDGAPIELVEYDDASDPKEGATIATRLTSQDEVVAAVSGSYSPQTLAAAAIFQRSNIPMVSAYAVNPGIPRTGEFIFQQDFDGVVQGRAGAQALADQFDAKKPAIVSIDNDFGNALVEGFQQQADELGMEIVSQDKNQFGETNFEPIIRRAIDSGADSIYLVQYVAEGKQFLQAWDKIGADLPLMSTEGIDSAGFLDSIGDLAEEMLFTTNLNRESEEEGTRTFLDRYEEEYDYSADMVAASSHDAVMLLAEAMRQGGTGSAEIQEALAGLKNFEGATGTIEGFNQDGQVIKPVQVQKFEGGEVISVGVVDDPDILTP